VAKNAINISAGRFPVMNIY